MTEEQLAAVVMGPLAVVFGVFFIMTRHQVAAEAQKRASLVPQTPGVMAACGALAVLVGLGLTIAGLAGWVQ
ncbi:hypothetical protein [Motilibacter deserti]|uniref:Secreted protein with PEP-CTERM sorting signal n=1 Tax=Motilibacter deserti TaxID=2714956 RepID=A0ABX0H0P4_9ACTN|nr:hypothetical protein [Motilibacter deserti]NHC15033.1 hypothetical protein [Motilibacter deserti]